MSFCLQLFNALLCGKPCSNFTINLNLTGLYRNCFQLNFVQTIKNYDNTIIISITVVCPSEGKKIKVRREILNSVHVLPMIYIYTATLALTLAFHVMFSRLAQNLGTIYRLPCPVISIPDHPSLLGIGAGPSELGKLGVHTGNWEKVQTYKK